MTPPAADAVRPAAKVTVGPGYGWASYGGSGVETHLKGYLFVGSVTLTGQDAARHLQSLLGKADNAGLADCLRGLGGHFAFVHVTGDRVIASVDRIASTPLLYADRQGETWIDDRGVRLRDALKLGPGDVDRDQALAVMLSGWTIGGTTLYAGLRQLRAGEALIVDRGRHRLLRWFTYDAWVTEDLSAPERQLSDLHRFLIERLAASAAGRPICIPLSAGLDSRMIASGLKAIGYKNVRLFAYGRAGNHEATASKAIAERLGYPWVFVPFSGSDWRRLMQDAGHDVLWSTLDDCSSVPFEQDWPAILHLQRSGYIPADAILVNGQSGDYLTGNHIPAGLFGRGEQAPTAWPDFIAAFCAKHANLWTALSTPLARARLSVLWRRELEEAGFDVRAMRAAHGAFEFLEFQDRQSKYVVSGQRTYDALGLDWRLPLWDDELIEFWRRVPLKHKLRQNLYSSVLQGDNWGGVWDRLSYPRYVTPRWLVPLRLMLKAASLPFGRQAWHDFERHFLLPVMDPLRLSGAVPYGKQILDRRGARHIVAWLVECYLARHGVPMASLKVET